MNKNNVRLPTGSRNDLWLEFQFGQMLQEIEAMRTLARPFIDRKAYESILPEWKQTLKNFRSSPGQNHFTWAIDEQKPVLTEPSEGKFEVGRRGKKRNVAAELSATWSIKCSKAGANEFILADNASTVVRILDLDGDGDVELARWQFDVATRTPSADEVESGTAKNKPGNFFHLQVDWRKADGSRSAFPVPRFPSSFVTPMDALDFTLSELFSDRWKKHAIAETRSGWARHQKRRISSMIDWQSHVLAAIPGRRK